MENSALHQAKNKLGIAPDQVRIGDALALATRNTVAELDALFEQASAAYDIPKMDLAIMALRLKQGGV